MKIAKASIQNYSTQTGIGCDPVFQWKYGSGTHFQTAYRICVYDQEKLIASTEKIVTDSKMHRLLLPDLEEQKEYFYQITVWDENDQEETSTLCSFLTGVKNWTGTWIGNGTRKPFLARKTFFYKGSGQAILSVCGVGQFEAAINGKKVGNYAYEGSHTDFDKHIHYYTYDVTSLLSKGNNELCIEVANGWYLGDHENGTRFFYTCDKGYRPFGECLALIAQLKMEKEQIVTDASWQVSPSQTVLANIYGSEDMDHTLPFRWEPAQLLTDLAPKGQMIPLTYPPIIRKSCYAPVSVDRKRMIFDFGQNMSSQFSLKIKGRKGQIIKLIPAEKLSSDGDILPTVDTCSLLTLSGDVDVFEQRFSVNGARWYKIEGLGDAQILDFHSWFTTSSAEDCGSFCCSDPRYNQIYHLILKAIESNLNHSHTDCPTIEKLGWLEPNHLMARAVMYNKNVDTLWSKIAMDMRDSQYGENESDLDESTFYHEYKCGLIPSIAPRYARFLHDCGQGSFWDIIPWGSSIILAAWEQYRFYGNQQILADNYESAMKYLNYLTDQYRNYDRLYQKNSGEHFICAGLGDWGIQQNKGECRENIETAFYYLDLVTMAAISSILNKGEEDTLLSQAEDVKRQYNHSLLVTEGSSIYYRSYDGSRVTQANQAIPLCFGLVPDDQKTGVSDTLIRLCDGTHLQCGEIGLVYILRALSAADRHDLIHRMILQEEHPSYLRFVLSGETTLPEFWRDDARSRNHDMMGHIMEWFFTEVAGIKSDDGFRTISVEPKCTAFLDSFSCEYESVRGKITVKWENGKLDIEIPMNCRILK